MKILHLVHNFPPEFTGGTELYVAHVAAVQQALGHEVLVAAGTDERDEACRPVEGVHDGIRVLRLRRYPRPQVLMTDTFDPLLLRTLRAVYDRERPHVVHAHHWFNLTTSHVALAAEMGIPAALTFHDLFAVCPRFFRYRADGQCAKPESLAPCAACCDEDYPFPDWERQGDYRLRAAGIQRDADAASRHLFPSRAHRDTLAPLLGSGEEKTVVLPHGMLPLAGEPTAGDPVPDAFSPERPLRIGFWGNLVRPKGVSHLLEAAARLQDKGCAVHVKFWGKVLEPGLQEEIDAHRAYFPLDCHGEYAREILPAVRGEVDLACFVSELQESYSFTVDEAAWLGLPVVVSDRGAPQERVTGWGRVVRAGAVDDLERALADLYARPEALRALARSAPEPPPVSVAGTRLVDIYEEIVAEGPPEVPPPEDVAFRLEHWFKRICARESWLQDLGNQDRGNIKET